MPRARLTARAAALAAVCAVGAAVAIATATAAADPGATAVRGPTVRTPASERATVRIGGAAAVAATPTAQGFLGIATSLSTIPALSGSVAHPDIPFVKLLRSLSPGAPVLLRLGGNSGDGSWWPVPGVRKQPYLYMLSPAWGADVRALLKAVGGTAIIGVNLKAGPRLDAAIAPAEVGAFDRYLGPGLIDAFELGNEPEFFPLTLVTGVRGQRGPDTIAAYGKLFSHIASMLGGAPVAGPSSVGPVWQSELGTILGALPSRLKLATVHAYPMKNCSRLAHLSIADFFTPASIQGLADSIHQTVTAAAAHGKPLRVDEINGITCGGKAGLSNTFGEALWALNVLPALWQAGVQGVNFQSVYGGLNQMIHAHHSASGWAADPDLAHFYQFAVRAPDGSERLVLTNVGSVARTTGVTASGTRGTGSLSLLSAQSLSATGGTTLGGQWLSSRTGQLTGTPNLTLVKPNAKRVYAVRVPAHAAAILTLSG